MLEKYIGQAKTLAALNRIPLIIAAGIAFVALSVWGVYAINSANERRLETRIEQIVSASNDKLLANIQLELTAQREATKAILDKSVLKSTSESLDRLQKQSAAADAETQRLIGSLAQSPDAQREVSPVTKDFFRNSRERFQ